MYNRPSRFSEKMGSIGEEGRHGTDDAVAKNRALI
jgi:hypothetical protein